MKRIRFTKLPIQANYYPVGSQMYIEDQSLRLTLLSGQPLGGTSLESGQVDTFLIITFLSLLKINSLLTVGNNARSPNESR